MGREDLDLESSMTPPYMADLELSVSNVKGMNGEDGPRVSMGGRQSMSSRQPDPFTVGVLIRVVADSVSGHGRLPGEVRV